MNEYHTLICNSLYKQTLVTFKTHSVADTDLMTTHAYTGTVYGLKASDLVTNGLNDQYLSMHLLYRELHSKMENKICI